MVDFLKRSGISDFDPEAYINSHKSNLSNVPNVAIACSGGGYRALMNGAGFIAAADDRTPGSTDAGGLGGLLQSSTYLAGLSGGGWLVGSIYANNFSTVVGLRDGETWAFDRSIFKGPKRTGFTILDTPKYWSDIHSQVSDKEKAGFNTSITDYWGRALSYQLIGATDGGPAYTFSSIAANPDFQAASQPMPILVADERKPGTTIISLNSTVFEFNPWEIGSNDPTIFGFVPMEYLGSNFTAGSVPTDGNCVRGFDQYGFMMGSSSSLFNVVLTQNLSSFDLPSVVQSAIEAIASDIEDNNNDIAQYRPNPFYGWNPSSNGNAADQELELVDGGEDLQNIPLHPLIQPTRGVDVIFAVDSSADTNFNWPNGTALRATWERTFEPIANGTQFPAVPDAETFINLGLNSRPTFFGCDTKNFTDQSKIPPLIVYVPNSPYTAFSNVSTFDLDYTDNERNGIIQNGYNVATMGNGTVNSTLDWRTCTGCAVLQRSLVKTGTTIPTACQTCFQNFCWNGTGDSTEVTSYQPTLSLGTSPDSSALTTTIPGMWLWIVAGLVPLVLAF